MRILVTGSRSWTNVDQIRRVLAEWKQEYPRLEIAHGKSKGGGVDLMVEQACVDLDIPQWPFPVLPRDGNHRGAPLKRNERMVLTYMPDKAVAFRAPGKSNGTDHCLAFAAKVGYPTETIHEE